MVEQGKTSDQISDAFRSLGRSDGYQGPGHDYVAGWVLVPGAIGLGVASVELMMGCAFAPLICSQSTIAAAEMAGGDAALGGTALGVFGGGASIVAGDIKAGMGGAGAKGISITIEQKIADQMGKRGWTESSIQSVIDKPVKTVVTKDTRFDTVSGNRLNDPATGYIAKDGSYVVRNDRTGAIVQVSNKKDPEWVAPWD